MNTDTFNFFASVANPEMWSECSWVMRIAEISRASRPSDFMRLNVSRQEIPASTRMRAPELSTSAVFPRLPLANTETETPILRSIHSATVDAGVTLWLIGTFEQNSGTTNGCGTTHQRLCAPALRNKNRRFR